MNNVPNFDAMTTDELNTFWFEHQQGRGARRLFPDGGKGTRRATADLANYASNKGAAFACRLRGDIEAARMYEAICDRIYVHLPLEARW